jgi:uncharacterized peroxidase-related enzyme
MAHGGFLRHLSDDPVLTSAILHDYRTAALDPQTRAILDFVVKLTNDPAGVHQDDFRALQAAGLDDPQALSVVLITAEYAYFTRVADGLGVEVPEGVERALKRWLTGPAAEQDWLIQPKR